MMRLQFLGTAAAEAIPALWCNCQTCAIAKARGGKELRRRCSYLIDDDTMVDFGPDAFWQVTEFNIDLINLRRIIFTHPHEDHLNPVELYWRFTPHFSHVSNPLTIIGSQPVFDRILKHFQSARADHSFEKFLIEPKVLKAGVPSSDGDLDLLPLAANHAPGLEPLVYVISRGGKRLLIANDTGWLPDESWQALAGIKLDAVVIESTGTLKSADLRNGHLGFNTTVAFRDHLGELGCLSPETQVVTNHFSHNGAMNHAEMVDLYGKEGFTVAFDGMVIGL
jgi:phosphoribosyl 1,2-cyclic phosphate phosphodiesterase